MLRRCGVSKPEMTQPGGVPEIAPPNEPPKGWWNLDRGLAVGGVLLAIVSLAAAYYWQEQSQREREPMFAVEPVRALIYSPGRLGENPSIRVLRSDGSQVTADVVSVRFYFWNNGKEAIRSDHVIQPLVVRIDDVNARILDYRVVKTSRSFVDFRMQPVDSLHNAVGLEFDILDHDDGATGEILYEGNPSADVELIGAVEGAPYIQTTDNIVTEEGISLSLLHIARVSLSELAVVFLALFSIALFGVLAGLLKPRVEFLMSIRLRRALAGLALVLFVGLAAAGLYRNSKSAFEVARRRSAEQRLGESVPDVLK